VVAVIDSGIRPGFPALDGAVVGCEDFVGDGLGCSNSANSFHGTATAGLISANARFAFSQNSALRLAVEAECPTCFLPVPGFPANSVIPMIGSAPGASIYAFRVLDSQNRGTVSTTLKAIERVITLRESGVNHSRSEYESWI